MPTTTSTPAGRLGYEPGALEELPDAVVESFAGVANPFALRRRHR